MSSSFDMRDQDAVVEEYLNGRGKGARKAITRYIVSTLLLQRGLRSLGLSITINSLIWRLITFLYTKQAPRQLQLPALGGLLPVLEQ